MENELDPSLAILIPAYNEEARIGKTLSDYLNYFQCHYTGPFVVVVVMNGCRDQTGEVVKRYMMDNHHLKLIEIQEAVGKGGALIEGLRQYQEFDLVSYVDADGATAPDSLLKLIHKLKSMKVDVVVGSRWMKGAVIHQSQTPLRRIASRVFHWIVELLFHMGILDTQCPAKVIRGTVIKEIGDKLRIADLAFDVNLLFATKKAGFSTLELPTHWTDQEGSKVTQFLFRSSLVMFLSIVRLRLIYSPVYRWMKPLRPLEQWIYLKLGAPIPILPQSLKTENSPGRKCTDPGPNSN